jgi:hypothetical protein
MWEERAVLAIRPVGMEAEAVVISPQLVQQEEAEAMFA